MIFKKNKIDITADPYFYSPEGLESFFRKIPDNLPPYYKTIPKKLWNTNFNDFQMGHNTIKSCAGFINLFKRSVLFLQPFDLQLIFHDDSLTGQVGGQIDDVHEFVDIHPNEQFLTYKEDFDKYRYVVKIKPQIGFKSDVPFMMTKAWYHSSNLDIAPGILPNNCTSQLNYFILIPKHVKSMIIRKNEPIAYLTFLTNDEIIFKYFNCEKERKFRSTFSVLKDYVLNKI